MKLHRFVVLIGLLSMGAGFGDELSHRFHEAIRNGDLPALKGLLKTADLNVRDSRGATPLMYTAAFGNSDSMKFLLEAGADVNAKNAFDATALIWAAGDPMKSRILIEHGADVNARSKQGRTPLMVAARRDGGSDLVRLLLSKGADANAKDAQGNNALLLAAQTGDVESMRLLIAAGADLNATSSFFGITALANAVASNRIEPVRLLLAKGLNVNSQSTNQPRVRNGLIVLGKRTPLMMAAPYASPELIKVLLKAGADVNAKDVRGMTALMLAVASETQDVQVVKLLLRAGANVSVASNSGETTLDWANKFGSSAVIAVLREAGAKEGEPQPAVPALQKTEHRDAAQALEKSIALLQRSSSEYFKQSGCVGCHHQPLAAMAVRAARSAGVPVDEAVAREQINMIKSEATGMQEFALQGLDAGVPDIILTLLEGFAAAHYEPDQVTDSLVANIAGSQREDGSWMSAVAASRGPIQGSDIGRTVRALRALQVFGPPARKPEFEDRIARARAWLLKSKSRTNDDFAALLLGLHWSRAATGNIRNTAASLIAQQQADGGWGGNVNLPSDAFATGQTLYALREVDCLKANDEVYRHGVRFLLTTQHDDGSWYVRSRAVKIQPYFQGGFPYDHDQWISAAATAWASVAVARSIEHQATASGF